MRENNKYKEKILSTDIWNLPYFSLLKKNRADKDFSLYHTERGEEQLNWKHPVYPNKSYWQNIELPYGNSKKFFRI